MSGMIRRLRWKIVGISMLFVTLVLAAVFTGVMLTARSSLEQSSTRQLEKALRGEGYNGQDVYKRQAPSQARSVRSLRASRSREG